jgi:hypothetical protein
MSDFAEMLDNNNTDLDTRIQIASDMVKQAAEEEGYDVTSFSQEELGVMIGGLVDSMSSNDNGKTAGDETAPQLTYADVALELNKRAAAQGVDLSQLDPVEFSQVYDKIAAELSDPEYAEEAQKVAAQEQQMDHYGRVAARGFVDEINKLAADEEKHDKEDDDDEDEKKEKVAGKVQELIAKGKGHASKAWGATKGVAKNIGDKEKSFHEGVGRRVSGGTGDQAALSKKHRNIGRALSGGAAAAAGGGAAYASRGKKANLEELAGAIDTLRSAGYDI